MICEKCVGKELGDCKACDEDRLSLLDRRGVQFPVIRRYPHRSAIFNSVPVYMADRQGDLQSARIEHEHFIFTVESRKEVARIIDAYESGAAAPEKCRRIK